VPTFKSGLRHHPKKQKPAVFTAGFFVLNSTEAPQFHPLPKNLHPAGDEIDERNPSSALKRLFFGTKSDHFCQIFKGK